MEQISTTTPPASTRDSNTSSALLSACKQSRAEVVKLLLEYGALINLVNDKGEFALLCASKAGYTEIVINYC